MASDDDAEHPRETGAWDGVERRKYVPLPKEVGHYDATKMRALLECIEFSGVDLLDPHDKIAFTERLAEAKRNAERRKRRAESRPKIILGVIGAIASTLFTVNLPDIIAWVKSHLP